MNFKKRLLSIFSLLLFIIPINSLAYSEYIVVGGNNIGIEVNFKEVIVVGFYEVNGKNIGKSAGFQIGDKIVKVENENVSSINDMIKKINKNIKNGVVNITITRNNEDKNINLKLIKGNDGIYKTGLYVKDQITGIGTLTYIDPQTKIFGALGHEIIEANSNKLLEIKSGKIFEASVIGLIKSTKTTTGEKTATFHDEIYGNIKENTTSGIYGTYFDNLDNEKLLKVANPKEIKLGAAKILTVLDDNNIEEYNINILRVNNESNTKNILFEINDDNLMKTTNGIIKGMSGSPIIQDNMIIGAVTHAIVNDNTKGYGIFITTMLEEGEN